MNRSTKMRTAFLTFLMAALIALAGLSWNHSDGAKAGPDIVGNPSGSNLRALIKDNNSSVLRVVYFPAGVKTMANTTPVASQPQCGLVGSLHSVQVVLVGTMTGTNPTLAVQWQNSLDGVNWNNVGTLTTINATVTPATQNQTVADLAASTAVAFGDCWRATYTFGGTGTVTANIGVVGIDK